ncbi:PREDICTED: Bardet-Biedl syndrome 7 protein-like [Rhagoletis zephyria]|uniref:Bardet-Biedl syndrome 7 protein-like n=1 Tax=Rhagoletis zephyria TaxID=28612 RepID=UPI00081149CC|nr:PREDICTED: Bardet-Biedl syndrome 7 protein-like [Rhagoletis zephyria]
MRQLNPNYLIISKDNANRIETLKEECEKLEKKLDIERQKYEKHTSSQGVSEFMKDTNLSALPFFTINDSFVLHNDASYVLMLEVEVAIDVVFIHCDIGLDLIDCERNSAVISFNDPPNFAEGGGGGSASSPGEMLATFRCQANTTRLEIRLRPVEGQHGTLSVYVVSRITPKSCLTRSYEIQPLALHKRQHSNTSIEFANSLVMTGAFGINDAHTWLRMNIPEIPEKLSLSTEGVESEVFYYTSTMTRSILIVNCGRGTISITSDNVSTVSILKDFLTREATRQSIPIEISVSISERSIAVILRHLYPKIKRLILEKQRQDLFEAISDLQSSDADIASQLLADLNLEEKEAGEKEAEVKRSAKSSSSSSSGRPESTEANRQDVLIGLDRIYGIITDLFIDYHKLKGTSMASFLKAAKEKLDEMTTLIETAVLEAVNSKSMPPELAAVLSDGCNINSASSGSRGPLRAKDESTAFAERLYHFWDIQL